MSRTTYLGFAFILALATACGRSRVAAGTSASHPGTLAAMDSDTTAFLLAAGDIAACTAGSWNTARLLDSLPGEIIVLGDAAYTSPRDPNPYRTCYDTTWGRHKSRTHPVPGNHDMEKYGLGRYFEYFGPAAGPRPGGYYSFDVGRWHVLALNSNIPIGRSSRQGKWAAADLAAHPTMCTLAYMHFPRFSSGPHTLRRETVSIFRLLDSAGVDVFVSGHDHIYERFAPMRHNGVRDDSLGIRQFVVGTGGNMLYPIRRLQPNSEAQQNEVYGVLKLTLYPRGYAWEYIPADVTAFEDKGRGTCH